MTPDEKIDKAITLLLKARNAKGLAKMTPAIEATALVQAAQMEVLEASQGGADE